MPAPSQPNPGETLRLRQILIWTGFALLLAAGIVLWFRFSDRILPMVDALTDR